MRARVARPAAERRRAGGLLARMLRCAAGVSAVEFAIVSPVLVLGTFGMIDTGTAIYQRMMMNQVLRAGAHPALQGANDGVVLSVLEETAGDNFTVGDCEATGDVLALCVETSYACPGDAETSVLSGATCESGTPALRFYRLTASKTFQGVLLPEFNLYYSLEVMQQ